jgi:hypothetical protein
LGRQHAAYQDKKGYDFGSFHCSSFDSAKKQQQNGILGRAFVQKGLFTIHLNMHQGQIKSNPAESRGFDRVA